MRDPEGILLFHSSPSQSQVKPDPLTSPVTLFVMHSCPARDVDMRVRERTAKDAAKGGAGSVSNAALFEL